MRLRPDETAAIKETFLEVFGAGRIYLFGSRLDDRRKGGDIDLLAVPETLEDLGRKKIDFLVRLKRKIGERKIDLIIDRGADHPIVRIARREGKAL